MCVHAAGGLPRDHGRDMCVTHSFYNPVRVNITDLGGVDQATYEPNRIIRTSSSDS